MRRHSEDVIHPAINFVPRPWGSQWSADRVIEVLEPLVVAERRDRIRSVLGARVSSVTVLMDAPHDPHNGAAVLRSCDAFGLNEVHVIPRHEEFAASNVVSRGAERWVDVIEHRDARSAAKQLRDKGFELIATHPEGELEPEDLRSLPRVALILGNEHVGIGPDLRAQATGSVRIPMVGFVESLNMSVSAAILVRAATAQRPGDLTADELRDSYAQGLYRSVKRAAEILRASEN